MVNNILVGLLLLLLIVSPFLYASVSVQATAFVEIVIAGMVGLWLLSMITSRKASLVKTGLFIPSILFSLVVCLQIIPLPSSFLGMIAPSSLALYEQFTGRLALGSFFPVSIFPDATVASLLKTVSLVALFFLIIHVINTPSKIRMIFNLLISLGVVISIFGIIQTYTYGNQCRVYWFEQECITGLHFGPFIYRNNFAGYILLIIPLALGFALMVSDIAKKLFYISCALTMSVALIISASRAGLIVFIAVLLCMSMLFLLRNRSGERRYLLVVLWAIPFMLMLLFFKEAKQLVERFGGLLGGGGLQGLGHGYPWFDILRIYADFPLLGTGLGTFGSISAHYKSIILQYNFTHAHCDLLQLLSEVGSIGFGCMLWFFIVYLKNLIVVWGKRKNPSVVLMVMAGFSSVLGGLLFGFLDFNFQVTANVLLFVVVMALTYALSQSETEHAVSREH